MTHIDNKRSTSMLGTCKILRRKMYKVPLSQQSISLLWEVQASASPPPLSGVGGSPWDVVLGPWVAGPKVSLCWLWASWGEQLRVPKGRPCLQAQAETLGRRVIWQGHVIPPAALLLFCSLQICVSVALLFCWLVCCLFVCFLFQKPAGKSPVTV